MMNEISWIFFKIDLRRKMEIIKIKHFSRKSNDYIFLIMETYLNFCVVYFLVGLVQLYVYKCLKVVKLCIGQLLLPGFTNMLFKRFIVYLIHINCCSIKLISSLASRNYKNVIIMQIDSKLLPLLSIYIELKKLLILKSKY